MADRSITVKIGANITGYMSALKTMATATQDAAGKTSSWMTKNRDGINEVSNGLLKAGLAATAFAVLAVTKFADFDAAMSSVGAATMETAENMSLLRQAALDAGADTQYSATQAAGAIEALAKAGVQTTDILKGGLTGALNLAASAQMDVGQAAEIAATTMNQFGLKGKDASHIADVLAASAGKAMGDVTDMAGAFKFVGPVANQMGISLEETAGTIAYLAQQGVLGEQAGTSLRGMLTGLTSPSKIAAKEMENLGLNVYDANGQFVGFNGVAQQLKTSMTDLTAAERDESLGRIFGNEQITTARLLYQGGAKAVDTWTTAVNDSGFAAEQARIKTDNLKGDIERLGGSFETALIQSGSGANNVLRQMAQGAESVVDAIGGMPEPILNATTLLAGAGGLAALGIGGLGKLATSINDTKVAVQNLGIGLKTAGIAAGVLGGALVIGTLAFADWAKKAAEARARAEEFQSTLDGMGKVTSATMSKINSALSEQRGQSFFARIFGSTTEADSSIDLASRMGIAIEDLQGYIVGQAGAIDRVNAAQKAYMDEGLRNSTEEYRGNQFEVQTLTERLKEQGSALTTAQKAQVQKTLADEAAGVATDENTSAVEKYVAAQESGTVTVESYTDALKELLDTQREAAGVVLSERDAQRQLEEAYKAVTDALNQQVEDLAAQYVAQGLGEQAARARAEAEVAVADKLDITTDAGRRNQEALDGVADSGWALIDSMRENGATQGELQAVMQTTRDRFVGIAQQMGLSADEANALADELKLIPSDVNVDVAADTSRARQQVDLLVESLNNRVATIQVRANMPDLNGAASGSGRMGTFASGGPVYGPGTGTSDSIAAYLSNGEYVIRAAAVARYGRHHFDRLNAMQYATGGMVGMRPAPAAAWSGPSSSHGPASVQVSVTGPVTVRDENALAERLLTRSRDAVAAYGLGALGVSS